MEPFNLSRSAQWATIIGTGIAIVALYYTVRTFHTPPSPTVPKTEIPQAPKNGSQEKSVVNLPQTTTKPTIPPAASEESSPLQLTDKQSRFSKLADADVSVIFNNFQGRQFAKLTVAAAGKEPVFLPIHGAGQSLTFESRTGEYIASVLSVDFDSKTLEVRVSKKN